MSYFSHSWLPYIYQYVGGGLIFVLGLILTIKAGSFDLSHPRHKKWLIVLVLGFVWYMVMHGAMTLAALGHEMVAVIGAIVVMAFAIGTALVWNRRLGGGA